VFVGSKAKQRTLVEVSPLFTDAQLAPPFVVFEMPAKVPA
jgi:hypothetical protein